MISAGATSPAAVGAASCAGAEAAASRQGGIICLALRTAKDSIVESWREWKRERVERVSSADAAGDLHWLAFISKVQQSQQPSHAAAAAAK